MSSIDLVVRYLVERSRLRLFVPLALVLAATGSIFATRPVSVSALLQVTAQALFLVLAFRVWDDLEDRARDAREHPERVMVTSERTAPFVALAIAFGAIGVSSIPFAPGAPAKSAVLGTTVVLLALWYRLRGDDPTLLRGYVVLLKYPAIAYAVAPEPPRPIVLAGLFALLCVYEEIDTYDSRRRSAAQ